jgi:hypothetical protein
MIDERPMAVNRLQFGIDCQIGPTGLAAAIPHLTRLRFTDVIVVHRARLVELLKPAKSLGITLPSNLIASANAVIE